MTHSQLFHQSRTGLDWPRSTSDDHSSIYCDHYYISVFPISSVQSYTPLVGIVVIVLVVPPGVGSVPDPLLVV